MSDKKEIPEFGDYVNIEQKRHGVENEIYLHKVICSLKSNTYVSVPVQTPAEEIIQPGGCVDVVSCVCCGVEETEVRKYRLEDIRLSLFHVPRPDKGLIRDNRKLKAANDHMAAALDDFGGVTELEAELSIAKKCNSCLCRQVTEPLSCNGNEYGTCDQDGRDNERIVELESGKTALLATMIDLKESNARHVALLADTEAELAKHKWISVEDRLPDDETEVLVTSLSDETIYQMDLCDGKWRNEVGQNVLGSPTHWMELPAHPSDIEKGN